MTTIADILKIDESDSPAVPVPEGTSWSLTDVAPRDEVIAKGKKAKPRSKVLEYQGTKQSHKGTKQSRRPKMEKIDAIKFGHLDADLSNRQKTVISMAADAAYKRAQRHHADDGLSADEWRQAQSIALVGTRVKFAKQRDFPKLATHFYTLAGDLENAFYWASRDSDEAQRGALLVYMIRELLKRLAPLPGFTMASPETAAHQQAFGDTISQRYWGVPVDRLDANQADHVYRQLKPMVKKKFMEAAAAAYMAKQAKQPTPEGTEP